MAEEFLFKTSKKSLVNSDSPGHAEVIAGVEEEWLERRERFSFLFLVLLKLDMFFCLTKETFLR